MDNNGFISKDELTELFRAANLSLPGYRVREIVQELTKTSNQLTFQDFTQVSSQVKGHQATTHLCSTPLHRVGVQYYILELQYLTVSSYFVCMSSQCNWTSAASFTMLH